MSPYRFRLRNDKGVRKGFHTHMRIDVDKVQDVTLLRQVIHLQEAENARLHQRLSELTRRLAQMEGKSESAALQMEPIKLSEQLATMQHRLYGRPRKNSRVRKARPSWRSRNHRPGTVRRCSPRCRTSKNNTSSPKPSGPVPCVKRR